MDLSWYKRVPVLVGGCIGAISLYVIPLIATAMINSYGLNDAAVGYTVAIQLGSMALAAMLVSRLFARITNTKVWVTASVSLIVVGSLLSAIAPGAAALFPSRALVGFGEGLAFGLVMGIAALDNSPHRQYSLLTAAKSAFAIFLFIVTPIVAASYGGRGAFVVHGLAVLALSPFFFRICKPQDYPLKKVENKSSRSKLNKAGVVLLLSWGAFQISINTIWTFVARIAEQAGVDSASLSVALILSSILAFVVPVLTTIYGLRSGYAGPLALAAVIQSANCLIIVNASTPLMYFLCLIPGSLTLFVAYPYISALAARIDPEGGLCAALPAAHSIGSAVGPAVSGVILTATGSLVLVGYWAAFGALVFFLASVPFAINADRNIKQNLQRTDEFASS